MKKDKFCGYNNCTFDAGVKASPHFGASHCSPIKVAVLLDFPLMTKKKNQQPRSRSARFFSGKCALLLGPALLYTSSYLHLLLSAGHRGRSGGEEPQGRLPHVDWRRGAGNRELPRWTQSSVGPSQVRVCRWLLRSLKHSSELEADGLECE